VKLFQLQLEPDTAVDSSNPGYTKDSLASGGGAAAGPVTHNIAPLPQTADPTAGACSSNPNCLASLTVPVASGTSTPPLLPGKYTFDVAGVFQYYPGYFADAECSAGTTVFVSDPTWQRNRFIQYSPTGDMLDLYLAGAAYEWKPRNQANPLACQDSSDFSQHTYTVDVDWNGDGHGGAAPMSVAIFDPGIYRSFLTGSLTVHVYRFVQPETFVGEVTVNSMDPAGSMSPPLLSGKTYRLEVTGSYEYYGYGGPGFNADAECSNKGDMVYPAGSHANDTFWTPHRFDDLYGSDPLDLYITYSQDSGLGYGPSRMWAPKFPDAGTATGSGLEYCADEKKDPNHTYQLDFVPDRYGPINLRILEASTYYWYTDNTGILTVKIFLKS
jgi:hypothetical protein